MNVTIFTDDYDNITTSKSTDISNDYDTITSTIYTDTVNAYYNMTLSKCTYNENDIDINTPALLLTNPCGMSFLCMMIFMVNTSIKLLFNII